MRQAKGCAAVAAKSMRVAATSEPLRIVHAANLDDSAVVVVHRQKTISTFCVAKVNDEKILSYNSRRSQTLSASAP